MIERLLFLDAIRRRGSLLPLVLAATLMVGIGATVIGVMAPRGVHPPHPAVSLELGSPRADLGQVGGLLPDAPLMTLDGPTRAQDLRPALFAVASPRCGCEGTLARLTDDAATNGLPLVLVGDPSQRDWLLGRARSLGPTVVPVVDTARELVDLFPGSRLTVFAVHADGIIAAVIPAFGADSSLGPTLATLRQPGA